MESCIGQEARKKFKKYCQLTFNKIARMKLVKKPQSICERNILKLKKVIPLWVQKIEIS